MAAPNIVNVATITGKTDVTTLTTTNATSVLSNANASGKVFKINTIIAANIDGANNADITVSHNSAAAGGGTDTSFAKTITVPADASLVIVGKDNPIYLEENKSITAQASAASDITIICSYEEIS